MIKRTEIMGIALATALSYGVTGSVFAAETMTPEQTAAELQQALLLDADITQAVEATVRDGKIVLTGQVLDQQAMDKVNAIIQDMDIDDSMIENQILKN